MKKIVLTKGYTIDNDGYIYIVDSKKAKIFKFDSNYKFISSFGSKGNGPGEFIGHPYNIVSYRNKIIAPCSSGLLTNIYSQKGTFLKKLPYKFTIGISGLQKYKNKIIAQIEQQKMLKSELYFDLKVVAIDTSLSKIKNIFFSLKKNTEKRFMRLDNTYIRFSSDNDFLYVVYPSESEYKIMGFNDKGKEIIEINKNYISKENKNKNSYDIYGFTNNGADFFQKKNTPWKNKPINYKAISYIFNDKFKRLWVVSPSSYSDKKNVHIDIFEEGVFLKSIPIKFLEKSDFDYIYSPIYFYGDKLYYIDSNNKEIKIYTYSSSVI